MRTMSWPHARVRGAPSQVWNAATIFVLALNAFAQKISAKIIGKIYRKKHRAYSMKINRIFFICVDSQALCQGYIHLERAEGKERTTSSLPCWAGQHYYFMLFWKRLRRVLEIDPEGRVREMVSEGRVLGIVPEGWVL